MANTPKAIKRIARNMIERDAGLRRSQQAYERMSRLSYTLPGPLSEFEWIRPIVSTAPFDALRGATRALANLEEKLTVHPVTVLHALGIRDDEAIAAKILANQWEEALRWQFGRSAERRRAFRSSVIWSACLYDEIDAQIIHLPTQFKARGIGGARERAALRFGDWAVRLVDPKTVHVEYSEYMPERVLSVTVRRAWELVDFWGDRVRDLAAEIERNEDRRDRLYLEFDYVDFDARMVWAVESQNEMDVDGSRGIEIMSPGPWLEVDGETVPFLNWVTVAGGTDIDAAPEHQRKPILYPVLQAEQWASSNIFGTILNSLALAEAAAPVHIIKGPGPENVEFDYTTPGGRVHLSPLQTYERAQRLGLDPAMRECYDRIEAAISKSTVAEILVTGQPAANVEAYAGYNLQVLQALASLGDKKGLGESFYKRSYEYILLMTHYTGGEIAGFGPNAEKYVIDSEDIDPEAIQVGVELTPDVPVDRVQRITAGVQLAQAIPYSPQRVLQFLGETDPEGALRDWKLWQLDLADFKGRLQRIQMEASGEIEQMAAQKAQEMLQQMMEQAQAQQGAEIRPGGQGVPQETRAGLPGMMGEAGAPPAQPGPGEGIMGVEGQGFNPAQMGIPPAMAAPGATREGQTGRARGGLPAVRP